MPSLIELRAHAREFFDAGVAAADPQLLVQNHACRIGDQLCAGDRAYDLSQIRNLLVSGCGKATGKMALAIEEPLGEKISGGIIVVKYGHKLPLTKIKTIEAAHPVPDQAGLAGARQMVEILKSVDERDLIIFLISGGGSALLPLPADGLSLDDKRQTTEALLKSGAAIAEVNAVRKHLSQLKGGQLARLAAPARIISLILSDVVGDSLEAIASGPTVGDLTTYTDCLEIIRRYNLRSSIPSRSLEHLHRGARGEVAETPKPGNKIFERVHNVIIGNNRAAIDGAKECAEKLGYRVTLLPEAVEGEARTAAKTFSLRLKELAQSNDYSSSPACVIAGGETTVTVRGGGLGGRCQEFALAAAIEIEGLESVVVLSGGTDGNDGPTDAAGGIIDGLTIQRGRACGLRAAEFLADNDSYHFLQTTGDQLITGPTLTNVMDLYVALIA